MKTEKSGKISKESQEMKSDFVVYTYVGFGETPPQIIKFMDQIFFRRGEPVKIENNQDNALLINKLENNKCFIKGEIKVEDLMIQDQKAKEVADAKREADNDLEEKLFMAKQRGIKND